MRVILVSDDSNFFEYIIPKLLLRKSDELFKFSFDKFNEKLDLFKASLVVINSENAENKALKILHLIKGLPSIVFAYNENSEFKIKGYKAGMGNYMSILTSDEELQAKLMPLFQNVSLLEKNLRYREMLTKHKLVLQDNDIYTDYNAILDAELNKINVTSLQAVLIAIAVMDKTQKTIKTTELESILLKNIRQSDILMKYAVNRYFLLLYNVNQDSAKKIMQKIQSKIPEKLFIGYASVLSKTRQNLVDEVLSRLHEAIKYDKDYARTDKNPIKELGGTKENFKIFKQEFVKKLEQLITPAFYHIQQKYAKNTNSIAIEIFTNENEKSLIIRSRNANGIFRITYPGYTKINIDILYSLQQNNSVEPKRINFEPNELEFAILADLCERFIEDFIKEITNENS